MGRRIASAACFGVKGRARSEQANSDDAATVDLDQGADNRIVKSIQLQNSYKQKAAVVAGNMLVTAVAGL